MTDSRTFVLRDSAVRARLQAYLASLPEGLWEVVVRPYKATRTLEQNAKMWAVLTDISKQVQWDGEWRTPEDWKDLVTAALRKIKNQEQRLCRGLEGGLVALGERTRQMSIEEMSEVIEYATAWGAMRGVRFGDERRAAA